MNQNQVPFGWNPNLIGGMPPFPGQPGNCNCKEDIRNLEGRINRLERTVRRLEDRVSRIEQVVNAPTPYNQETPYQSNYTNGYNMM